MPDGGQIHIHDTFDEGVHSEFLKAHELVAESQNASLKFAFKRIEELLLKSGEKIQQKDIGIAVRSLYENGDTAAFDLMQKHADGKPEYTEQMKERLAVLRADLEADYFTRCDRRPHSSLHNGDVTHHIKKGRDL